MLEIGKTIENTVTVTESNTAKAVGSGSLAVFATPALAALAEETACMLIANELEEGTTTVGSLLNIKHLAPTPVGMEVKCVCTLTEVSGRRLCFTMEAFDGAGKIGEADHERFIVPVERFMEKAQAKLGN